MKVMIAISLVLISCCAFAQQKLKFHSQNYISALGGEFDAAIQFSTINGLQHGLYFGGVGTGIDYYYLRSVPLYLSFSRYLNDKRNTPYLTLDGGTNFLWDKSTASGYNFYRDDGDFTPSLYYAAHAGYKMGVTKKSGSVLMSLGFSAKKLKERINTGGPCWFPPCPTSEQTINYNFNRFIFRLGWLF
jgi:hypothetical protein